MMKLKALLVLSNEMKVQMHSNQELEVNIHS